MSLADNKKLGEQLRASRREAEERAAKRTAEAAGLPYVDMRPFPVQPIALGLIDEEAARNQKLAAIAIRNKDVVVATPNPNSDEVKKVVQDLKDQNYNVRLHVCSESGLKIAFDSYQFVQKKDVDITGQVSIKPEELIRLQEELSSIEDVENKLNESHNKQTTEILEIILAGSLTLRASDVHIEPQEKAGRLRYRIDGELNDIAEFPLSLTSNITSRLKLLSTLKLNVKDEPQDGRFTIKTENKNIEIRTSTIPSEYGEVVVLRVLDPDQIKGQVKELGFRPEDMEIVDRALKQPNGMILNTGPTGSGKTTTLYAFIRHIYSSEIKVITIEDPIEYHIEGISQTQVDPKANYTFASGLRSILRQDPDVILVGEIRDVDTAEIAMHAALTGHLVFSTLHTNEAAAAIPRLIDMGAKPQIIGPSLNLVIAQRLVRRFCQYCKKETPLNDELREKIETFYSSLPERIDPIKLERVSLFMANSDGCEKCHGGYKGRIGIFELFRVTDTIKQLMHEGASDVTLKKEAVENGGMLTLQQDGILKVLEGQTDFKEIERVTGPLVFENTV